MAKFKVHTAAMDEKTLEFDAGCYLFTDGFVTFYEETIVKQGQAPTQVASVRIDNVRYVERLPD